jgi:glycopeptide antibiotics resistance protein
MTLRPNQIVASELSLLTDSAAARAVGAWVLVDLAGNVAVFIPLGMSLACALRRLPARRRVLSTVLAGAAFSLFIEVAQAGMSDRVAQLGDWLLNSAGMALGAVSATWFSIRSRSQTREG